MSDTPTSRKEALLQELARAYTAWQALPDGLTDEEARAEYSAWIDAYSECADVKNCITMAEIRETLMAVPV